MLLDVDNRPTLAWQPVGKGLLVVTSYYSVRSGKRLELARALWANALFLRRSLQAGLEVRSPASLAGLEKGMLILEYNGSAVNGRIALEEAWSAPGLPETVEVVAQDPNSGIIETFEVPRGDPKIVMYPRYEN